jgi:transcriptional regulator with XRE-family HTH domain
VRVLRAARRLSQLDLAAEAGMTAGAVSMIEARKANPTMDTLERIARAFGVDVTALFADHTPKP